MLELSHYIPRFVGTYDHFRVLGNSDTLALDNLNVVKATQNLVLDLELGHDGELGTLLNLEGLVLEIARGRQVDSDGRSAGRFHAKLEDNANSRIVGVGDGGATAAETEGFLVSLEGLIAFVWKSCN